MDDLKYQVDLLTALNERLMNSEKMYRHIAECTGDLFMYFDFKASPTKVDLIGPWDDVAGEKILNHPYDESYMLNFLYEEDQDLFRTKLLEIERNNKKSESIEVRSKSKYYWFSCDANVTYDSEDKPLEKIIRIRDITRSKLNSEELEYLAYYDSITGVYNRNYFIRILRDLCERAEKEQCSVELLFVDIDDFKKINDSVGLILGDELVQEFAQFLKEFGSEDIKVGRYGSDVFCIAVYNPCGSRSADDIYRRICERLHNPFILSNKSSLKITVSAGVSEYPDAGRTALEIIKNAEIVLYRAKEKGKNTICYFEPDLLNKFLSSVSLEKKMKEAVEEEDFILFYQPLYESNTGHLRGAEALIRWPNSEGGYVSTPQEFIPVAEKNGLIVPLGKWVLKEAMRTLNEWRVKYHIPMILCINISAVQLESDGFIEYVQELIQLYGINPEMLEFEITESVLISNFDDIINKIRTLRGIGIRVSLDDFGTGYSSLSYLKDLPIDTIKIDKSFVDAALNNDSCKTITESVISMVRKLGYSTVAEGVETKEQFNYLRSNNCDIIQGFLLGKPTSRSEFEKILIRQLP